MMDCNLTEELSDPIFQFQTLCQNMSNGFNPDNRFHCMESLERAVQQKNGAYTEADRRTWLSIAYACLEAPDCYFTRYTGQKQEKKTKSYEQKQKKFQASLKERTRHTGQKQGKKTKSYEQKQKKLQASLKLERMRNSSICTYIDCIRADMRRSSEKKPEETVQSLAEKFQNRLETALIRRQKRYPKLSRCEDSYKDTLCQIFKKHIRLDHPAYLMLLPYTVFFELAKCENLISENAQAFTILNVNQDEQIWTIRSSPLQIYNPSDLEQVQTLYAMVERALWKVLKNEDCHAIGLAAWEAVDRYAVTDFDIACRSLGIQMQPMSSEEKRQIWKQEGTYFSAPFWDYDIWTARFRAVFDLGTEALEKDLHRLFSLSFRPRKRQSASKIEEIRQCYENYRIELEGREFYLSELMLALAEIYNPSRFGREQPFAEDLHRAINLLTAFLNAGEDLFDKSISAHGWKCSEIFDEEEDEDDEEDAEEDDIEEDDIEEDDVEDGTEDENLPIESKWLSLLQSGYPVDEYGFTLMNPNDFLVNPSQELVKALILRAIAGGWNEYCGTFPEIQTHLLEQALYNSDREYYTSMNIIQEAMQKALVSPKRISRDVYTWGRIKVKADADVPLETSLMTVFHSWGFWHPDRMAVFLQIASYLKRKPDCLSKVIADSGDIISGKSKWNLRDVDFCTFDVRASEVFYL